MELSSLLSIALIIQIFVLLSPLSSFPVLMNAYKQKMNVKRIAYLSVFTGFIIAIAIVYIGPAIFNLFGVSLDSFRIAGGIVLLLLGLSTIRPHGEEHQKAEGVNGIISLIATPLLTGPATISFITIKTYELGALPVLLNVIAAFVLVGLIFVLFAHLIPRVNVHLVDIISRVLGLFLTAVAIEMIGKGILAFVGG